MSDSKLPSRIDRLIGQRLRWRRKELRLTQEQLGETLGLTFQQVQKYEKGVNRIGASRLYDISRILEVPVQFFYDDFGASANGNMIGFAEDKQPEYEGEKGDFFATLATPEGMQLSRAFSRINDPQVRRRVLELVKALAEEEER